MAKRVEPINVVMEFFEKESSEVARMAFGLVKGIVEKRGLLQKRKKASRGGTKSTTQESEQK